MESDKDEPLLLRYIPNEFNYINVGYSDASNFASMITFMEQKWENMDKVHSFKYKVYEQELKSTTSIFSDLMYILSFVSFLAISISCLGLLGMATFTAQSKKKEIRIRKIHSAKIKNIVFLLSKEFLWLFVVSIVITVPITYLINDAWLQEFSYRVDFNIWIILLGVGIMFLLGFGTILSQTFKVAASDPLKGLRNE